MTIKPQDCVIAVFERQPYWGPELQRQFLQTEITVRECRSVADLLPSIDGFHRTLVLLDLEAGSSDCLSWLQQILTSIDNRFPIIACGTPATKEIEWTLREIGVTAFLLDVVPGDDLARLCRRQLGFPR